METQRDQAAARSRSLRTVEHRRRVTSILLVAALLGGVSTPSAAWAQGTGQPSEASLAEARARYTRGVELYNEGSFSAALVELERANRLAPNYRILFNIGLVQLQLGDFVAALRSFEEYLSSGAGELPPSRVAEAEERIKLLKNRIAIVEVVVNVPGAQVTVDDVIVGTSPLPKPLPINPGKHKVAAIKRGYTGEPRNLSAAGQDKLRVELALEPVATPSAQSDAPLPTPLSVSPRAPEPEKSSSVPWLGLAATGVLAGAAVATGILAVSSASDLQQKRDEQATPGSQLDDADSKAKTFALVSDICTAGAVIAGGVTIYLWLKPKPEPNKPSAGLRVLPTGVSLAGRF